MSTVYFPSLSEDGWITSPALIADSIFSQFFLSDYSQTQLYLNKVSSFAYVIQKTQGDVLAAIEGIRQTLQIYFGRYFTDVVVEVTDITDNDDPSKVKLTLYITFVGSDGLTYSLSKIIQTISGKVKDVITLNNTGTI